MAINALQVAWLVRLAKKGMFRPGSSIIEFGPQDLLCSRSSVELLSAFNPSWKKIDEVYDGDLPRNVTPSAFYELFGIQHYKSVDGGDPRADWLWDLNNPFSIAERFDIATNMGTFEHVFNIGTAFRSLHEVLKPGGLALHVLPAFGDIDHGFFNIHPTTYFDLAHANGYVIEDLCYVDRWDIRVRVFEKNLHQDYDFDALPVSMQQLRDPAALKEMTAGGFARNFDLPETIAHCAGFPGRCFDYCLVALRKVADAPFRYPMQGTYGGLPYRDASTPTARVMPAAPGLLERLARKHLPTGVKAALRPIVQRLRG